MTEAMKAPEQAAAQWLWGGALANVIQPQEL